MAGTKVDRAYVMDVRDAAEDCRSFVHGVSRESFLENQEKQAAVLLKLIVMGEATKRLSKDFRTRTPNVPWAEIAGMRDRLAHGYDQWDLEEVWKAATVDIPELIPILDRLLIASSDSE